VTAPLNAFTVDLEEWFHVCGVGGTLNPENWDRLPARVELTTHILLDALARAGVRATFFVVGWIAERYPHLVEAVREAEHEIGSHGYRHERVYDLGPERFASDLRRSVQALHAVGVPRVTLFRAPEWSINDRSLWALEQLASPRAARGNEAPGEDNARPRGCGCLVRPAGVSREEGATVRRAP